MDKYENSLKRMEQDQTVGKRMDKYEKKLERNGKKAKKRIEQDKTTGKRMEQGEIVGKKANNWETFIGQK